MKTDATLKSDVLAKVMNQATCCSRFFIQGMVLAMVLLFSSTFIFAQSGSNGDEPLVIVKKEFYPGDGVVPVEVQDILAEYAAQQSIGVLGDTEPSGTPPTIENCPDDQTVECFGNVGHTASELEYTINCGPNGIIIIYEPPGILETGSCPGTEYPVVYDVWDQCGNNVTCEQIFTIDNPGPDITSCPEGGIIASPEEAISDIDALEFTFSCPDDPLCSDISVSVDLTEDYDPCLGDLFIYTYTITDACGRTDECEQIFTIPPPELEIVCNDSEIVECVSDINPSEGDVEIIGLIEGVASSFEISEPILISGEADCSGAVYEVAYSISDDCDRQASCTRTYTIENEGPTITAPNDVIIECAADADADIDGVSFTTSCDFGGVVTAEGPILLEGDGFCDGSLWEFVYTVTDDCGRTASASQQVTIENDGASIEIPADVTINCDESTVPANTGMAMASEACAGDLTVSYEDEVLEEACPLVIARTWSAESECDGTLSGVQIITVVDEDAPTLILPQITEGEVTCSELSSADAIAYAQGELSDEEEEEFLNSVRAIFMAQGLIPLGASDECGDASFSEIDIAVSLEECPTLVRFECIFVAVDECGNTSEPASTYLNLVDNTPPVITCPEDITISCEQETSTDVTGMASATDDCSEAEVTFEDVVVSEGCPQIIERTFTATDACGLTSSCVQQITITYDDPTITAPEAVIIECATDAAADIEGVVFTTACDLEGTVTAEGPILLEGDGLCDGSLWEFVYTVTDDCGRTASASQQVTIENDGPSITAPEAVIIECAADAAADIDGVSFTTSCDLGGVVTAEGPILLEGDGFCDGSLWEFVYTVTDDCGRTASASQQVAIENDGPSITAPDDVIIECAADAAADIDGVSFTTSCDLGGVVTAEGPILLEGDGFCDGSLWEFVYTVTDDCGRTASASQQVAISNEGPTITAPNDVIIECAADADADIDGVSSTTSCDFGGVVTAEGPILLEGDGFCDGSLWEFVYTVTDDCGRTASASQQVTIENDGASIEIPADVTINCDESTVPANTGMAMASEACAGDLTVSYEDEVLEEACPLVIARTWSAESECDGTLSGVQIITVVDEDAPTLILPQITEGEVTCSELSSADAIAYAQGELSDEEEEEFLNSVRAIFMAQGLIPLGASDECGDASFSEIDIAVSLEECPTLVRFECIFVAVDECGNTSEPASTYLNLVDNTPPVITCPEDITISCEQETSTDVTGMASATDDCSEAEVTFEDVVVSEGCPQIIERTFTATDACGLTSSCVQQITITYDDPTITAPEAVIIECATDAAADIEGVVFTTACDLEGTVTAEGPILLEGDGLCDGSLWEFVYTVTDDCGRTASASQQVTIENDGPSITAPEAVIIECAADAAADIDGVSFTTSCDLGGVVTAEGPILLEGDGFCDGSLWEFVYTVTDDCGRTASASQQVAIENDGPSITAPDDVIIECAADAAADIDGVSFTTSCDLGGVVTAEGPILLEGDGFCDGSLWEFVYTVTDDCGRTASASQQVAISNEGPTITAPNDVIIECAADADADIDGVSFTTSCDFGGVVTAEGPILLEGDGFCDGSLWEFVYTVTDDCGRTASASQQVAIENDGPSITAPDDVIIECAADAAADIDGVSFTTSCDLGGVVTAEGPILLEGDGFCDGSLWEFVYTVTDDCGRTASASQQVAIENDGPSITAPDDVIIECAADAAADIDGVSFTTSCDLGGVVTAEGPILLEGDGFCDGSLWEFVYTVTDDCGRTASASQQVSISNDGASISVPEDVTITCEESTLPANTGMAMASEACAGDLDVSYEDVILEESCPLVIERTWSAESECDGTLSGVQIITVEDNEAPELIMPDVTEGEVTCSDLPLEDAIAFAEGTLSEEEEEAFLAQVSPLFMQLGLIPEGAVDACGDASWNEIDVSAVIPDETCPTLVVLTCIFVAEDECGNVSEPSSTSISIVDNTPPVISCPMNVSVSCEEGSSPDVTGMASATDDCSTAEVTYSDEIVSEGCPTIISRTFTATDECGLTSSCTQEITITYDVPTITAPEDVIIECAADAAADIDGVSFTTACDLGGVVTAEGPILLEGDGFCDGSLWEFVYTVTDDCGRTASASQQVAIENDGPSITAPEAVIIECAADAAADIDGVSFTTSCDLGGVVTAEGPILLEGDGFCDGSLWEFVYTVTDDCGRTASASQQVTIENDGPSITALDDVIIECAADAAADIDGVSFTTSCDLGGVVTAEGPILLEGDGFCSGSLWEFVYTVTDDCGRTASASQQVSISNDGASISVPEDVTITCEESTLPANTGMAMASEACAGDLDVSYEDVILEESCPLVIERTWSAESECDGTLSGVQIITVEDNEAPELIMPDVTEVDVTCSDLPLGDAIAFAEGTLSDEEEEAFLAQVSALFMQLGLIPEGAVDNCGDASFTEIGIEAVIPQDVCPTLVELSCIFVAIDDCENVSEPLSTTISIVDNTAPEITCPEDITVSCEEGSSPDVTGMASATDDCSTAEVTYSDEVLSEGCPMVIARTFTATDECGLTSSCTQEITITYDVPTITAPDDVIIECAADAAADIDGVSFTTGCDLGGVVTAEGPILLEGDGFCDGSLWEFVYTLTDDCGRTASASQQVAIENDGPSITAPDDVEVICIDEYVTNVNDASIEASCDLTTDVEVSEPMLIDGQGSCNLTQYEITYTVTDQCGRSASDVQIVTCINDGLEIFEIPSNEIVTCYDDISPDPWAIEYFSPCSSDVFIQVTPPTQLCCTEDCPGAQYSIIYTITNDCGDEEVVEQIFTIENEGPAIITCGEDEEVESVEDIEVSVDDVVYETACGIECDVVVVTEPEVVNNGCDGTDYIYTYTITDNCGRTATCDRVFTVPSDDPNCNLDDDCENFSTYYVDIDGNQSTLYSVEFTATDAMLTFETQINYSAHIAFDADNNVVYFVHTPGSAILAYDPSTGTELFELSLSAGINRLCAVVYNPSDDLIYVGDGDDNEIYTIDPLGLGEVSFFANAPVSGGDLAIQDGELYLINRTNSNLYTVVADDDGVSDGVSEATLVGATGIEEVSGMAQANNATDLIFSVPETMNFTKVNAADGSTVNVYMAMVDGDPFVLAEAGDMAAGCAEEVDNGGVADTQVFLSFPSEIFPNPSSDHSVITFEPVESVRTQVELFDMSGRPVLSIFNAEVKSGVKYRVNVNTSTFENGVYICRITNGSHQVIKKLMITD